MGRRTARGAVRGRVSGPLLHPMVLLVRPNHPCTTRGCPCWHGRCDGGMRQRSGIVAPARAAAPRCGGPLASGVPGVGRGLPGGRSRAAAAHRQREVWGCRPDAAPRGWGRGGVCRPVTAPRLRGCAGALARLYEVHHSGTAMEDAHPTLPHHSHRIQSPPPSPPPIPSFLFHRRELLRRCRTR